ncbi:threonine synthase [Hyperthermus butylicus]|uniref:Threonine synthase n=1 Tax=Hyperthermus butylicus (strain DSM 5456 / JCM 9403 / PLM1-5) TaxID=415426 RepID=A2BKW1_HYPBU|nr:pyridoxal-phosphate dependent enzyme [Hyperthermus butylicus]ABM80622.1 Threonine synthase [Hyperthermus butylicus DSM 5456]
MAGSAEWICPRCGWSAAIGSGYYWRCPRCSGPLQLRYTRRWEPRSGCSGLAKYSSMLPLEVPRVLGEGGTPLVERRVEGVRVFFKLEYLNPTGSFKDRGTSLALAYASRMGFRLVVEDTSGNTGISVAAYAAAYGLRARIYMPVNAPEGKKRLVRALGGEVVLTPSRGEAAQAVLWELKKPDVFYVAHTWSPFYVEGAKTIAFEAFEDGFRGSAVLVPVGSGGLLLGIYHGFRELVEQGLIDSVPRIIAVQGYSNPPLYRAVYGKEPEAEERSSRLADGLMVSEPPRLGEAAEAVKATGGCVILVDDEGIRRGLKMLASMGFIVEPTSATLYPALLEAVERGCIDKGEEVLAPLTGSGLKTLEYFK